MPLARSEAGLTNGESEDGGFEEFFEFCFNCASRSAIRAVNTAICSCCATTNAANSSTEGFGKVDITAMIPTR